MQDQLIQHRDAADLKIHPLANRQPMLPPEAPESLALVESMALYGQERQPLIITEDNQVMDGRHRLRDGLRAGITVFACIVRPEHEAAAIIAESLVGRRHYTKGARAYLVFPLMDEAANAIRDEQIRGLKAGKKSRASAQQTHGGVEAIAERFGFGRELYFQAKNVHAEFAEAEKQLAKWRAANPEKAALLDEGKQVTEAPPNLRAQFEPAILAGDLGLGGAMQAIAGVKATRGKPKVTPPEIALLMKGIDTLSIRLGRAWKDLPEAEQETALFHMGTALTTNLPALARKQLIGLLAAKD